MDILFEIAKQAFVLGLLAVGSGVITSGMVEILKFEVIKIPAQRYPRVTAAIIATLLSALSVFSLHAVVFTTWVDWVVVSGATLVCALKSYDWVLKGVYEKLRSNS